MNIIVEGPDASGKSTLVHKLAQYLNWRVIESPGPPECAEDINTRLRTALAYDRAIFDRHPAVSERIYGPLRDRWWLDPSLEVMYRHSTKFVVYCQARYETHVIKTHDTASHLTLVRSREQQIARLYDQWSVDEADYIYRGGDMRTLFGAVEKLL